MSKWLVVLSPISVVLLLVSLIAVGAEPGSCASSTASADDVVRLYRQHLGRDPENDDAVNGRVGRQCADVEQEIANSVEALIRRGDARALLAAGRRIFRFDTFGDEAFWGDTLGLHKAIIGERFGGVGGGISPRAALGVGLKVDVDALPDKIRKALEKGEVNLDDPATTVALLKLNAVIGVTGFADSDGKVKSMGIQCALCHSTVDNSFAPGIGHRLDGWPNRDLRVGEIVKLAPNLKFVADFLGVDVPTVNKVLTAWGPGKFDAELFLDGKGFQADGKTSAATLIPPAYGLAGVNLHTYTGWGSVTYWNAFVANLEMHGIGNFFDPRLDNATKFPIAAAKGLGHTKPPAGQEDRITSRLAALHLYQLSLAAPKPPPGSFDRDAANRGSVLFQGKAKCATCHVPPLYTEPGWNLHAPADVGIDSFQADRSPDGKYRTTPLGGLGARNTQQGGFFHDGRFGSLLDVVNHYNSNLPSGSLNLTDGEKRDLVEFLKSL